MTRGPSPDGQSDHVLKRLLGGKTAANTVRIDSLTGPTIKSHPWATMLGGRKPEVSALSKMVPADQYFVQCRSLSGLLDLLDFGDLSVEVRPDCSAVTRWVVDGEVQLLRIQLQHTRRTVRGGVGAKGEHFLLALEGHGEDHPRHPPRAALAEINVFLGDFGWFKHLRFVGE